MHQHATPERGLRSMIEGEPMKHQTTSGGGLQLEFDSKEVSIFRHLVERAAFIDTPPQEQEAILRLADQILAALGQSGSSQGS